MPHIIWKTENFIIQACRGSKTDYGMGKKSDEQESDAETPRSVDEASLSDASPTYLKPAVRASLSYILLANSFPPGFVSGWGAWIEGS